MKQLFVKGGNIEVGEVPLPACPDKGVLVRNIYSLISIGTETMIVKGEKGGLLEKVKKQPQLIQKAFDSVKQAGFLQTIELVKDEKDKTIPLGYSTAGVVVQVGRECRKFSVGQTVACAGAGLANHSEFIAIPENLCAPVPEGVTSKEAAFTTVGSIALQGVRQGKLALGENVVVIGLGLIGLLTVQIAKASGTNVIGIDIDPHRMEFVEQSFGVKVINANDEKLYEFVSSWSDGVGADCVLITAGTSSNKPIEQAMHIARRRGRVVAVGAVSMDIPRSPFYEKELNFTISCSYGPGRYDPMYEKKGIDYPIDYVRWTENRNMCEFLRLIKSKKVSILPLVTSEYELEKATEAFEDAMSEENKPIGVVIRYKEEKETKIATSKLTLNSTPRVKKLINFAMVGCGNHAKTALLPAAEQVEELSFGAAVGKSGKSAQALGKKFGAQYCTANYQEVLDDPGIDLVIIATRHNLHYPMIMSAIEAGKDIFVEKPVALGLQELINIYEALDKKPVNFTVGHNRRFSPLAKKAKLAISKLPRPFFINYQINAGFFPQSHWIHDPSEGGGRIVGEVCHFIDLSNFFVGTDLTKISVQGIPINNGTVIADDNISLELQYADGSMSVITYTSLGNPGFPKEQIQIHANRGTVSINNFESIEFFGIDERNKSLSKPDKGFNGQLVEFVKKIKGKPSESLSAEESLKATYYSIKALESLRCSFSSFHHPFMPETSFGA